MIEERKGFTGGLGVTCGVAGLPGLGGTTGLPSTSCDGLFFAGEELAGEADGVSKKNGFKSKFHSCISNLFVVLIEDSYAFSFRLKLSSSDSLRLDLMH